MYKNFLKRFFDFFVAAVVLAASSPVIVILAILLFFANGGRPFFTQQRPGRGGNVFKVIKFKTMNDLCDATGKLLPDKDRLTTIGKIVRATSLDELPQLINVLKGDMSLVGPRPLLVRYLALYNETQARRHEVRPGITGWAQVNGRNALSWQERFMFDVYYVDNVSFSFDMKIIFMTVKKVFIREGISAQGNATMPPFTGNDVNELVKD